MIFHNFSIADFLKSLNNTSEFKFHVVTNTENVILFTNSFQNLVIEKIDATRWEYDEEFNNCNNTGIRGYMIINHLKDLLDSHNRNLTY